MTRQNPETLLGRLNAALGRIEAALPGDAEAGALADLQARHDRLRAAVSGALAQIDALIVEQGGSVPR